MREHAGLRHGTRVVAALAGVVLLIVFVVAITSSLRANHAAAERANRLDPAGTVAAQLYTAIVDERSAVRGYVLKTATGEGATGGVATAVDDAIRRIDEDTAKLRDLLSEFPALLDQVGQVSSSYDRWQRDVASPVLAAIDNGQPDVALDIETRVDSGTDGGNDFAALRAELEKLTKSISDEQADAASAVKDSASLLLTSGGTVAALVLAMTLLVLIVSRRWLLAPINELRWAVNAVAAGRYDTTIPAVGPREIVDLASNVEAMRAQLVSLVRQNERSWTALAQEGQAVIALRDALTPSTVGEATGLELRGRVDPAEGELAGDWFDAIETPDGRVAVVVGDVAGHGAAPGVFALRLKQLMTAALSRGMEPGTAVQWVVEALGDTGETFATALVALIDPHGGEVVFTNAGHPDALVLRAGRGSAGSAAALPRPALPAPRPAERTEPAVRADVDVVDDEEEIDAVDDLAAFRGFITYGDLDDELEELEELEKLPELDDRWAREDSALREGSDPREGVGRLVEPLASTGPLLSSLVAEPGAWRSGRLRLAPGDVLFVYTDGLVEARDDAGRLFGRQRLVDELVRVTGRPPSELLDDVFGAVREHAPGRPSDDRTAIALSLRPPVTSRETLRP